MTKSPSVQEINPPSNKSVVNPKSQQPAGSVAPSNTGDVKKKDSHFRYFVAVTSIALAGVFGYFILTGPFSTAILATVAPAPYESASLLFAYPLTIKADGEDMSVIDVFIADREGKPIPNKTVIVRTSMGTIKPEKAATDVTGHAQFSLSMEEPGIADISLTVDGLPFSKRITVKGE